MKIKKIQKKVRAMLEKHNYLDCAVYEYYKHCIQELRVHDN